MNQPEIKTQIENFINHCVENGRPKFNAVNNSFDQFEISGSAPSKLSVFNNGEWINIEKKSAVKNFEGFSLLVEKNLKMILVKDGKVFCSI